MRKVFVFLALILFVCAVIAACGPIIVNRPVHEAHESDEAVATTESDEAAEADEAEETVVVHKTPVPKVVRIVGYAVDYTDHSIGFWNSQYPHPSFDDERGRRGRPNGEWDGSYHFTSDRLYLIIDNLFVRYPPTHTLGIGYTVTLKNATFEDGSITKKLILFRYSGRPSNRRIEKSFRIIRRR